MNSETSPKLPLKALVSFGVISLLYAFFPLLVAARWEWWQGWVYAAVTLITVVLSRVLAWRAHPDVLAERAKAMDHADTKEWDKKLAPLIGMFGPLAILLVCGLDARWGWSSPLPVWVHLGALVVVVLGNALGSWALIENRFFSGVVRIQTERGHHVVESGPYRLMRHPGYAGAIWVYAALPFLLNSLWALIPVGLTLVLFILRTGLEDKTLQAELPGYKEYTHKTRYRLLPGLW